MITYRLSERKHLIDYLMIDPNEISAQIDRQSEILSDIEVRYEAAWLDYKNQEARYSTASEASSKARSHLSSYGYDFYRREWLDGSNECLDPEEPNYSPEKHKAKLAYEEAEKYLKSIPRPLRTEVDRIASEMRSCRSNIESLSDSLDRWRRQTSEIGHDLPRDALEAVASYSDDPPVWQPLSDAELAGYIRGEIGSGPECVECERGYLVILLV